jgi:hypothetical protein
MRLPDEPDFDLGLDLGLIVCFGGQEANAGNKNRGKQGRYRSPKSHTVMDSSDPLTAILMMDSRCGHIKMMCKREWTLLLLLGK